MPSNKWKTIRMGPSRPDLVWELFHENSKTSRWDPLPPAPAIRARMDRLLEALSFDSYPAIELPAPRTGLALSLSDAIAGRKTGRRMEPCPLTLEQVSTLLHYAYGITRSNEGTVFPRPFRAVPSGGALYPLELFFHSARIEGLDAGLYHYNPTAHCIRFLRYGDESRKISDLLVQSNIAVESSLILYMTAIFERSVFKYGNRGYRFVLLEAGHVGQNLNLVAAAMGLGTVNIGGYFDRSADELLGIDGLTHSTVYMMAIGKHVEERENSPQAA